MVFFTWCMGVFTRCIGVEVIFIMSDSTEEALALYRELVTSHVFKRHPLLVYLDEKELGDGEETR